MPLTDVGNGVKLFEVGDAAEHATKILGLADLANKLKKAPYDLQKAQADAIVATQDASPDALRARLIKQQAEAMAAVGAEKRARADFTLKALGSLPDVAGQNFEASQLYVNQLTAAGAIPAGTQITKNEKAPGTFSLMVPRGDGSISALPIDPNRAHTAAERANIAKTYREEWAKVGQPFSVVQDFHRNFESNINVGTGASDHIALFSALKMLDRSTQVGTGQTKEFMDNVAGLKTHIQNLLDKSTDPKGPVFGKQDGETRNALIEAVHRVYANAEHDTLQSAQFFSKLAQHTDDPEGVIQPFGGIGYKQAIGAAPIDDFAAGRKKTAGGTTQNVSTPPVPTRRLSPTPQEAGVGRFAKDAPSVKDAPAAPPAKTMSLDEILNQNLFSGGK